MSKKTPIVARFILMGALVVPFGGTQGCKGNLSKYDVSGVERAAEAPVRSSPLSALKGDDTESDKSSSKGLLGGGGSVVGPDGSINLKKMCKLATKCFGVEEGEQCLAYAEANPPTESERKKLAECLKASQECKPLMNCLASDTPLYR